MKPALSIVFVLLYTIAMIRPAYPLVEYYIKLDEYQAKCLNKAQPQLHCNGQCILMQKLKAVNGGDPAPTAPAPAKINLEEYPVTFLDEPFSYTGIPPEVNTICITHFDFPLPTRIADIFHPPS
jgi:hypothetical protein